MVRSGLSGAGKGCSFGSQAHAPRLGTAPCRQTPDKAIPGGKGLLGQAGAGAAQAAVLCPLTPPALPAPLRPGAARSGG